MVNKIFYDTKFIENGVTVDLVSLGAVDDHGREFYAVSTEFNPMAASVWVSENVLDNLPPRHHPAWKSRLSIRDAWLRWLTESGEPLELWAYHGAYDHLAHAQLFGSMTTYPKDQLPTYTNELMQLWNSSGQPTKPPQPNNQHDALADARWNRELWETCKSRMGILIAPPGKDVRDVIRPRITGETGPEPRDLPRGGTVHKNDRGDV